MSDRNHWITFPNYRVIAWGAILPPPRGAPDAHVRFAKTVVDAGKRHGVWDAQRLPRPTQFDATKTTFDAYVRASVETDGRIPLLEIGADRPGETLWTPGRVAFYRDDHIVEEEVGNIGELLRTLRPGRETAARSAAPVTIQGVTQLVASTREATITIRLDTDIWFPRVIGLAEPDAAESYDNRALAERHTPRLNAFIRDVRAITLEIGGRWEKREPDSFGANYADQWDETGIRL